MTKKPVEFLGHILESIGYIQEYLSPLTQEQFLESVVVQDAVIRRFEIIGEATNNIDDKTKRDNPELPWRNMVSMRNFIIHEYFGVDYKMIWKTVKTDLPGLKKQVKALIKELS